MHDYIHESEQPAQHHYEHLEEHSGVQISYGDITSISVRGRLVNLIEIIDYKIFEVLAWLRELRSHNSDG
jgi:hypothetical protein